MQGPVGWRRTQHYDIHIGRDQLLVGIEAHEVMIRLDADARLDGGHQILGLHLLRLAAALDGDAHAPRCR
jgi:hypothetical protein